MAAFGVRFAVDDPQRFEALHALYAEIKRDKDAGQFRDPAEWVRLMPDEVKGRFSWPTNEERRRWLVVRDSTVIAISEPSKQLGTEWDFYRVFEAIEESEYDVLGCELVGPEVGELRVDPHSSPYGGVGPLIALAEAFGFTVLGVNEYGKYQPREQLLPSRGRRALCALAALAVACSVSSLSAAEPRTVPGLGLTLMPIPAGTFTMGRPGAEKFDGPQTRVTISKPFWLGQTEVTQGQWKALMGTDVVEQVRRQLADDTLTRNAGQQLRQRDGVNRTNVSDPNDLVQNTADDAPMYWVSWEEAVAFCRRLTERERAAGRVPAGYEYRLPTEAEWEYACRAGTTTATYAGEMEIKGKANAPVLDLIAWYRGNSSAGYTGKGVNTSAWEEKQYPGGTAAHRAVATKRPNDWGLYDMLGNVWEWCGDWHSDKLPGGSVRDPTGATAGSTSHVAASLAANTATGAGRVIRGGSWDARPGILLASFRIWNLPGQRESSLGFRPALAPQVSR